MPATFKYLFFAAISVLIGTLLWAPVTHAATESTRIIRQDCTGYTNCYTSLSSWEAAEQRDLTVTDEIAVARIEGVWSSPDTTAVTIDGWTTDATRYIKIYTALEARHGGVWNTGKYRLEVSNNDAIINNTPHTIIDGLQVKLIGTFARYGIKSPTGSTISNNLIWINNSNGHGVGTAADFSGIWKVFNNIIYKDVATGGNGIHSYGVNVNSYVYGNTVYGFNNGIYTSYQRVIAKNNLVQNSTDGFNGTFHSSSDHNISNISSDAPGVNSKSSITVSFVNTANGDFHLSSSDTSAIDAGTDLSLDSNLSFTTDIDGETRSGSWDIGADEVSGIISPPPTYQCSDSVDNDGDGLIDYPNDPGCSSTSDNDETNIISDTTPPVRSNGSPSGTLASNTTSTTISLSTNETATCKYGTTQNTSYSSITSTFTSTNSTSHSQTISGLQNGQSYTYYVRCQDSSGNANIDDYTISFSVATSSQPGAVTITTLPFNANTAGAYYILGSNLVLNSGNAVTISANNVTIDGNNFEIRYAETGQGYGILINTSVSGLEIKNLTLTQGNYNPGAAERVHGIYRNGNFSGLKIHNNIVNINHGGAVFDAFGYGLYLSNFTSSSANEIYSNTFNIRGTSSGRGISINGPSFNGSIHDNTVNIIGLSSTPAGYPRGIEIADYTNIFNNIINIDSASDTTQGISLWEADYNNIYNNQINLSGINSRAILIDGGSDYNKVYSNTIKMNSPNSLNHNSSGIRVRYGSSNNEIYSNNISDIGCAAGCFGIRHGEDLGNGIPQNNIYHDNIIYSPSRAVSIENEAINTDFYLNSLSTTQNGYAVYLYGTNNEVISDVVFSHENFNGGRVYLGGAIGQNSTSHVVFCQSGITVNDITVGQGIHDNWSVSSGPCPYGDVVDTTPPSTPSGLSATPISSSQINLSWTGSTDNTAVTGYRIYRGGTQIATSVTTTYSDTNLTASTAYAYTVAAYDAAGNVSAQSSSITATTQAVVDTAPPVIFNISSITTTSSATITFSTNELSDTQIEYDLTTSYGLATTLNTDLVTSHSQVITSLAPNTAYNYRILAKDSAGNTTTSSNYTFITQSVPDTTPPTTITDLSVSNIDQTSLTLSWTVPSDISGVSSYDVRYNTTPIIESNFSTSAQVSNIPIPATPGATQTQYISVGLIPDTTYYFAIRSRDPRDNISAISNVIQALTKSAPAIQSQTSSQTPGTISVPVPASGGGGYTVYQLSDSTAPQAPTNVKAQSSSNQVSLSWTNPKDADFVRVKILRKTNALPVSPIDGTLVYEGNAQTFTDINLDSNKSYFYAIYAYDNVPNYSTPVSRTVIPQASLTQTTTQSPRYTFTKNLYLGIKNPTAVQALQQILVLENVYPEAITTGTYGPLTKKAVTAFQKKYNLTPDGTVGAKTRAKLNSLYGGATTTAPSTTLTRNLTIGSRGDDVKKLQQILNADPDTRIASSGAGSPGNETTYFGPVTRAAVIKYQKKHNIVPAQGYVGSVTREVMGK